MLTIKNLSVEVNNKKILDGLNLKIESGEVSALMGPNGSGKSTLSNVLAGKYGYKITSGSIIFKDSNLIDMAPEERASKGLFLAFQYPVEIPGIANSSFLRSSINSQRKIKGEGPLNIKKFLEQTKKVAKELEMDEKFISRELNVGFSGGEKKKNEIFQMSMINPDLAILDEIDSGLDIDSMKIIAKGINNNRDPNKSILMITHYQRLLDYVKPDSIHIIYKGKIVKSGGFDLAGTLEKRGYKEFYETENENATQ